MRFGGQGVTWLWVPTAVLLAGSAPGPGATAGCREVLPAGCRRRCRLPALSPRCLPPRLPPPACGPTGAADRSEAADHQRVGRQHPAPCCKLPTLALPAADPVQDVARAGRQAQEEPRQEVRGWQRQRRRQRCLAACGCRAARHPFRPTSRSCLLSAVFLISHPCLLLACSRSRHAAPCTPRLTAGAACRPAAAVLPSAPM